MPAQASSDWMRRENAGCVTCRNCAEREKLRVSARLTKSSNHFVSTRSSVTTRRAAPPPRSGDSFLGAALLEAPHVGVATVLCQEFGMRAALVDAAQLHHEDLVGVHDG